MTRGYTFTPNMWASIATVVLLVTLSAYSARRRSVPGAVPFALGALFAALWAAGAAMEQAATDVATEILWIKFQAVWQLPASAAVTCFVLEYTRPGRWLTRRNVAVLSIPLLFVLLWVVTDDLHHLFWRNFRVGGEVIPARGPLNWLSVAFGYGLGLINVVALGWFFARSPEHRWPVAIILSGQIGARVVYAVDAANVVRSAVPLDVISLAYLFVAYALALFGFGMFDPIPLAHRTVITQMKDGVLVLEPQGRVASLNPAAQTILGAPGRRALGRSLQDLLPASAAVPVELDTSRADHVEINLGTGSESRTYALAISPLKDWRSRNAGSLLILRDVTDERRSQMQALQRQWAEATLQERELLAQELHDGLAQSLGFLSLQAQAAQVYLRSGETEAARESLRRLAQVAVEVQGDARQMIGNLLTVSLPSEGFCSTLRGAVSRFEEQTGLPARLEIDPGADAACAPPKLPPAAGVQLLRIVQEALANVRKHAGSPSEISVALTADDGQMALTVADSGTGFSPDSTGEGDGHFGLQVMRQRAARVGAEISVRSAPGEGTSVRISVPLPAGERQARDEEERGAPASLTPLASDS